MFPLHPMLLASFPRSMWTRIGRGPPQLVMPPEIRMRPARTAGILGTADELCKAFWSDVA